MNQQVTRRAANLAVNSKKLICRIYFHLNFWGSRKDDNSAQAHFESSKTSSRGSYLDPKLSIIVKIFEFYLVTQSL
jgi:hypothetical protein